MLFFQVREITAIARGTAADGNTAAALANGAGAGQNTAADAANTVINSNRVFINSLAAIADLAC